jgi:hypothetical protein
VTVFVSYSSRDRDAVKSLTQDLQDTEEQVWMDQRLAGGEAWWRAILEQIRGCDVFVFALSQNSIDSKPCQAELQYARALGLPILPVQVGPVDSMQLNPLATVQAIDYRHPTPNTGMRLLAALNRDRARHQPLPDPLPDEPPVPFEYLIRLYTTIAGPDFLSPRDQAALVAQLQVGLREDGDHAAARNDIVTLLTKLRDREDVTYRTRADVDAILASIEAGPPAVAATTTLAPTPPVPPDNRLPPPPLPGPVGQAPAHPNLAPTQYPPDRSPPQIGTPPPGRRGPQWPLIAAIVVILAAAAGIIGYLLRPQPPASQTPTAQPVAAPGPTSQSAPPPSTAPSAEVPGLAPFVGSWAGKRETVNIDANGEGQFHYMDVRACPSCAMADMPYTNMDFTLTSVSGNTATGGVTADKYHHAGEPVVITLNPATASAPTTISWTVSGLDEGMFCPASNSSWCGGL